MVQLATPLQTARLTLRPFALSDVDELAPMFGDDGVNRYLYSVARDRDATLASLERRVALPTEVDPDVEAVINVAIVEQETGHLVGDFMLRWEHNEHRQGEMGGLLSPSVHNRGYATEIYGAILQLAFGTYELHRIVGRCDGRNVASIRSLQKAGLRQEAHFRENEFVKGEWTDEVVMAILRSEWIAHQSAV